MTTRKVATLAVVAAAFATTGHGAATRGFSLEVVLDGGVRAEYRARGTVYVEAVRGRPYVLRITNPLPCTVGVALAVDGLNTIDARHGDARSAAKWVLPPYGSVEVPGWQVDGRDARRFYFTGERSSYGAWLGKTDDLGVIEAVFYRQRLRPIPVMPRAVEPRLDGRDSGPGAGSGGRLDSPAAAPPSGGGVEGGVEGIPVGEPSGRVERRDAAPAARKVREEYAATGIGERTDHRVEWVSLDLEDRPAAVVRIRYEFHDQLVRLGVLREAPDPLTRRERARGFSGSYCPEPTGWR